MKLRVLLCLCCVVLAGCSLSMFESKKIDYKSAGKLPPLEIPPDLSTPGRDERYAVPDIETKGSATLSTYSGERGGQVRAVVSQDLLPSVANMRIDRAGNERWLVVQATPEQVWPLVRQFWQETGFTVATERPEAGVMETDWAENRARIPHDIIRNTIGQVFDDAYSTPERDKFRTRIERGAVLGTTEIYISHRGIYEVYVTEGKDQTRWEPRKPDPDLEAEMLRRLMVRLGATEEKAKTQLTEAAQPPRAAMKTADGSNVLTVQEPFDRAWRRVGLALDRVGFTVEDRNRSDGLYFVRYVDPDSDASKKDEGGFWNSLKFWKGMSSSGSIDATARYRIHVKADGEGSATVQVLTREGGVDKSETSKRILGLLLDQLK